MPLVSCYIEPEIDVCPFRSWFRLCPCSCRIPRIARAEKLKKLSLLFGIVSGFYFREVVVRLRETSMEPYIEADWTRPMPMFPDMFSPPVAGTINTHAHRSLWKHNRKNKMSSRCGAWCDGILEQSMVAQRYRPIHDAMNNLGVSISGHQQTLLMVRLLSAA